MALLAYVGLVLATAVGVTIALLLMIGVWK